MGDLEIDPMLEIFFSETYELLEELEQILIKGKESNYYNKDEVQEIFRIFHTIKADATMMLFEDISETAKAFEKVLYYYREKEAGIEDASQINIYIDKICTYMIEELGKIENIGDSSKNSSKLIQDILSYNDSLTNGREIELKEKEKQVYYIAGKGKKEKEERKHITDINSYLHTDMEAVKEDMEEEILPIRTKIPEKYDKKKHNLIANEDMDLLKDIEKKLTFLLEEYNKRLENSPIIAFEEGDLKKLKKIEKKLKRWIYSIETESFSDIAIKMTQVAEEMSASLGKEVELNIQGIDTLIEKDISAKLSGAMIHILRNSIDHGIESPKERLKKGKNRKGSIHITIERLEGELKVVIQDDGKGLERDKILKRARGQNILYKSEEEYSDEEVYRMVLLHGFSTMDEITNYSGLGVGMDVVAHNIEELGGRVMIESKPHEGTKITLFVKGLKD